MAKATTSKISFQDLNKISNDGQALDSTTLIGA